MYYPKQQPVRNLSGMGGGVGSFLTAEPPGGGGGSAEYYYTGRYQNLAEGATGTFTTGDETTASSQLVSGSIGIGWGFSGAIDGIVFSPSQNVYLESLAMGTNQSNSFSAAVRVVIWGPLASTSTTVDSSNTILVKDYPYPTTIEQQSSSNGWMFWDTGSSSPLLSGGSIYAAGVCYNWGGAHSGLLCNYLSSGTARSTSTITWQDSSTNTITYYSTPSFGSPYTNNGTSNSSGQLFYWKWRKP